MVKNEEHRSVPAIKVRQWLSGWDKVEFSAKVHRHKPRPHFYILSLPAAELRSLCGIARRQTSSMTPRADDLGIQRQHDPERSSEIARFVEFGYPWSTLTESKRELPNFNNLRKPGWLPTAIVVNILQGTDERSGTKVSPDDIVTVEDRDQVCILKLPYSNWSKSWRPSSIPPLEVIDGQHRLWAFESNLDAADFEVPVVAFHGLDVSWQAYLFWTINIKPKRINASLAFDLYPLLRAEDWLDRAEGHPIYRETRSQELTEALWSHPDSPWYDRINMLGERQNPWVSQSAWIRSLMATFVRPWGASKIGGLFGSRLADGGEVLGWSRAQQAAFLLFAWQQLHSAISSSRVPWAANLRSLAKREPELSSSEDDPAFYGRFSLIVTDQGVRGYLHVVNDLCFVMAPKLDLRSWHIEQHASASDVKAVTLALKSLSKNVLALFIKSIAEGLATFDWRTSATPDISDKDRRDKLVYRGSSGYKELRVELLNHLKGQKSAAGEAAGRLV